jgi:glycosyltransferase involved in cell wall biosynthesis
VVEEAQGGIFVPPGDEIKLAETLLYLYENPQQGQNMGRSARRYVERHFHRNSQAEQFVLLVEALASER